MIVELFGPAGVGKTTLARAAEQAFRRSGGVIHVYSSSRPSESTRATPLRSAASRASKALDLAFLTQAFARNQDGTASLLRPLLPPGQVLWRMRLLRYISWLDAAWKDAKTRREIAIFDQGYISALGAVFLRNPRCDTNVLREALSGLPRADITIHVIGKREIITDRLIARLGSQSWPERLLELGLKDAGRQPELFTIFARLLDDLGQTPLPLSSINPNDLSRSVAEIVRLLDRSKRESVPILHDSESSNHLIIRADLKGVNG